MASITKRGDSYRIQVCIGYDSAGKTERRRTTYKPELFTANGKPP